MADQKMTIAAIEKILAAALHEADEDRDINNQHPCQMTIEEIICESQKKLILLNKPENREKIDQRDRLTAEEENIELVKQKMDKCLELLKSVNGHITDDEKERCYERANIFIYFLETLSLQVVGRYESEKENLQKHFDAKKITDYRIKDMKKFNTVRNNLLHYQKNKPFPKLELLDIKECIKNKNIKAFLKTSEKYIEWIIQCKDIKGENSVSEELIVQKRSNIGREMDQSELKSYVKEQFGKLIVQAYAETHNIKNEDFFNYVVNFHPACEALYNVEQYDLRQLRNKLVHEFHIYSQKEFRKEIHRLRHELFNYLYAQEVIEIYYDIYEKDKSSEEIDKMLKETFERFQKYINGLGKDATSTGESGAFTSQRFLPLATEDELLVDRCLEFTIIFDHVEEDPNSEPLTELRASHRREIFEEFDGLIKIYPGKNGDYEEAKKILKEKVKEEYKVSESHFDRLCELYVKKSSSLFCGNESEKAMKHIRKILEDVKDIKSSYNLPNRFVIFLFDQHLMKEKLFDSVKSQNFIKDENTRRNIIKKFEDLPSILHEKVNIPIEGKNNSIKYGEVISNMLNTFYGAYHKYKIQMDIKDIFNEKTFINNLVDNNNNRTTTEEEEIERFVDQYLKLTLMIDEISKFEKLNRKSKREIFGRFCRLKDREKHDPKDSNQEFYRDLVSKIALKSCNLNDFFKCIKEELIIEEHGPTIVKSVISLKVKLHELDEKLVEVLTYVMIAKLYRAEVTQRAVSDLKLFMVSQSESKKIAEILENFRSNLVKDGKLVKDVKIILRDKTCKINIWTVADDIRETFADELKAKRHDDMIIRKLLMGKTNYAAPFIGRLLTEENGTEKVEVKIQADDLEELVRIFLYEPEYMEHLNNLLKKKGTTLDLYEKVCDIIVASDCNIKNMKRIFEEYYHVKRILHIFIRRIDISDLKSYVGIVEVSRRVLRLLTQSFFQYGPQDDEERLIILDEALNLIDRIRLRSKKLGKDELMIIIDESGDSIVEFEYNIMLHKTRIIIRQWDELQDGPNKLEIFPTISIETPDQCYDGDISDFVPNWNTSCNQLKESYKVIKNSSGAGDTDGGIEKKYNLVKEVESIYKPVIGMLYGAGVWPTKLRSFSAVNYKKWALKYRENLESYYIKQSVAKALLRDGIAKKDVEKCKKAVNIYKEVHSYKEKRFGKQHVNTLKDVVSIANASTQISDLMLRKKEYLDAFEYATYACVCNLELWSSHKERYYGKYDPALIKTIGCVVESLNKIRILSVQTLREETNQLFYKILVQFWNRINDCFQHFQLDESHTFTSKTCLDVASTSKS